MSLPYFPMYPSDFEAKTSHLSIIEDGAYNRLLRMCWMTPGCSIPDDEAWIMRRLRAHSEAEKEAIRNVIAEFFVSEDGRLFQPRLRREAMLADEKHTRRALAGRKGGIAKAALKTNDNPSGNAEAMRKQPEPEPDRTTETNVSVVPPKRKHRIKDDATITEGMRRAADKRGHSQVEADAQFEKFKNDALAKGKTFVDWDRAFITWLDSPYFKPITLTVMNGGRNGEPTDATDRLRRVVTAAARGSSAQDWG